MTALYWGIFFLALAIAWVATPLVKRLALKWKVVSYPNARRVHTSAMPQMGGLAIFIGVTVAFVYIMLHPNLPYWHEAIGIFLGSIIVLITGMIDDKYQISPRKKLLGQLLAATVVVASGLSIDMVNLPFNGRWDLSWLGIPFTILWIVGVTNAINLIDGLDGLAAGVSAIATATMLVMAILMGNVVVILYACALLGATLGFLYFNFHPAKIFMGDTGALFLGFMLASLSVLGFKHVTFFSFIIPIVMLGVPIWDTLFAIVRRKLNNQPISMADKGHLHHRLLQMGFSHQQTVLIIYGISMIFGLNAIIFSVSTLWVALTMLVVLLLGIQFSSEMLGLLSHHRPLLSLLHLEHLARQPQHVTATATAHGQGSGQKK